MKKWISLFALSFTFVLAGLLLSPTNSEARSLNYKIKAVPSGSCIYLFCTNNSGDECDTPGSYVLMCNEQ